MHSLADAYQRYFQRPEDATYLKEISTVEPAIVLAKIRATGSTYRKRRSLFRADAEKRA